MLSGIAVWSYAATALAFFVLFCLLLVSRQRPSGPFLYLACFTTSLWAAVVAYHAASSRPLPLLAEVLDLLRNAAWGSFLLTLLASDRNDSSRIVFTLKTRSIAFALLFFLPVAVVILLGHGQFRQDMAVFDKAIGYLALAVAGMLLIEQVFRNATEAERWAIKFACLGIGAMFVYDFYLYSDAVLFRRINEEIWSARGMINALVAPLIAIAVARRPDWRLGIAVSRRFLFHSVTLFGSAIYLLAMAAAGYYLRFVGGKWGTVMQVAFLFGAIVLLVAVMFSGAFRSWLKVFISKHFYTYNYDYREEWIRFTRTLSESGQQLGERAVQAIATLVESPGGALWIRRESGACEPVAHWNMFFTVDSEPSDSPFCTFLEREQWIIDLNDFASDATRYGALTIPAWLQTLDKAWLVVPLILHGKLFGFIVLASPRSAVKLNWEVLDLLKIAGNQAASYLAQNESANALMVARQFESFNRMSTFVVHDLKNLVAQLSLLLANADRHKDSPEFQRDMLETISYSVEKMKLLLQKFSRSSSVETPGILRLDQLLERVVKSKSTYLPKPTLELTEAEVRVMANAARLERVIGHLVQNAIEATGKDGTVTVRLRKLGDMALIEVVDSGHGMDPAFVEQRLFKPFESTKQAGMGIGVFEMREYILQLGGKVDVDSQVARGTTFKVALPAYTTVNHAAETVTAA